MTTATPTEAGLHAAQDAWARVRGLREARNNHLADYVALGRTNHRRMPTRSRGFKETTLFPDAKGLFDHTRLWRGGDVGLVHTAEPYDLDGEHLVPHLAAYRATAAKLGLEVTVSDESPWFPGYTTLICLARPGVWDVLEARATGDERATWHGDPTLNLWGLALLNVWWAIHGETPVDVVNLAELDLQHTGYLDRENELAKHVQRCRESIRISDWHRESLGYLATAINPLLTDLRNNCPRGYRLLKHDRLTWSLYRLKEDDK